MPQQCPDGVFYQQGPYHPSRQRNFSGQRPQIRGGEDYRQRPVYDNRSGYQQRSYGDNMQPRRHQAPRPQFNPYANQRNKKRDMCHTCGSLGHHSKDCDYNMYQIKDQNEDPNVVQKMTFFKSEFTHSSIEEHWRSLIGETANKALIDTGAVSTVCGRAWYEHFWKSLSEEERREVKTEHCEKTFLFGDSQEAKARVRKKLPVSICGVDILLSTYLVENDIPLLISAESMIKMRLVIDLNNQKVQFMGKSDTYQLTKSGHIVISIKKKVTTLASQSNFSKRSFVEQIAPEPGKRFTRFFKCQVDPACISDSDSDSDSESDDSVEYPIILPAVPKSNHLMKNVVNRRTFDIRDTSMFPFERHKT